jgi:hypothetical protein
LGLFEIFGGFFTGESAKRVDVRGNALGGRNKITNVYNLSNRYSPRFVTLDMHIRFLQRERVDIIPLQIGKSMIDESVGTLIRTDGVNDFEEVCVWFEAPVVDGDGRCWEVFPFWEPSIFNVVNECGTVGATSIKSSSIKLKLKIKR